MNEWPQWRYPRLRGYAIGDDGELTVHLCLGWRCCGSDVQFEVPPSMPVVEFMEMCARYVEMHHAIGEALPTFNICDVEVDPWKPTPSS